MSNHGGLLEAAFQHSSIPVLIVDSGVRVVAANDAYAAMTARARDELIGAFSLEFIHAADLAEAADNVDLLLAGAPSVTQRRRLLRGDGEWIEVVAVTTRLEVDGAWYLLIEFPSYAPVEVDQQSHLRTRAVLGPFGDATAFHDREGRFVFTPAHFAEQLTRPPTWLYGRRLDDPELDAQTVEGMPLTAEDDPIAEALATGDEVLRTVGLAASDGTRRWYSVRAGTVAGDVFAVRSTWRDVAELVEAERALAHQLDHDDLTGLATRRALIDDVERTLKEHHQAAIVFVDLDEFKQVNDEFGHLAGDDVLAAAAAVLADLAPAGSRLGRAGGDEFVLLATSAGDAEAFAAAVRERCRSGEGLATVRGRRIGASVGVGISEPGDDRSALFARADAAMYDAKRVARRSPVG